VILDFMLPGMDGLEVLKRIRAGAQVPVLMFTARGDEADRIVGLEIGADDYLPKTFSMRELLARLRAVARRHAVAAVAGPEPKWWPDRCDSALRRASRCSTTSRCALTPVEFDILASLMRAKGRVKTRDHLLEEIRDRDGKSSTARSTSTFPRSDASSATIPNSRASSARCGARATCSSTPTLLDPDARALSTHDAVRRLVGAQPRVARAGRRAIPCARNSAWIRLASRRECRQPRRGPRRQRRRANPRTAAVLVGCDAQDIERNARPCRSGIYRNSGEWLAGAKFELPAEVRDTLRRPKPGGPEPERPPPPAVAGRRAGRATSGLERSRAPGRSPPPGRGEAFPEAREPAKWEKFLIRTTAPTAYWLGIRAPLNTSRPPHPATLLIRTDSLGQGGLLLEMRPLYLAGIGAMIVSVLFWLPFVHRLTRQVRASPPPQRKWRAASLTCASPPTTATNSADSPPP
jgi:hypothetical protein